MTVGPDLAVLVWLLAAFVAVATVATVTLHRDQLRARLRRERRTGRPPRPASSAASSQSASGEEGGTSPLTDTERILELLDKNDGRLWQRDIHERTEWSKSKVSRLLSRMEEANQIRKIAIGRENIIALPGDEPELARSGIDP
jgi:uncharacterized membrane protein